MPLDSAYTSSQIVGGSAYREDEAAIVTFNLERFARAREQRYNFEVQWQEAALLGWPEYANSFFWGARQIQGEKKSQKAIDGNVAIASHRFAALVCNLWTPSSSPWTRYYHEDEGLMRQKGVAEYYDELTRCVWRERYKPTANFRRQNLQNCQAEGMFGNMNLFVDELDPEQNGGERGLRYTSVPVGQVWYILNHQGAVCGYIRAFRWTAQQIMQKWPDTFPNELRPALQLQSQEKYDLVQCVYPRTDWVPWRLDSKGKRFVSYYISLTGQKLLEEGGYRTFPMPTGRYMVAPFEDYGRGPMQMVLPSAKTLNMMKSVYLEQGHLAGKPIYITTDSATFDLETYPRAINKGGLGPNGEELVKILPTGNIQITKEMMDEEKIIINDAFLVSMFSLALKMEEAPNLSARQVMEMIEQRGMFLAPISDGPFDEYLGSLIPRELDILSYQGLLPKRPDVLVEANSDLEYEVEYTNPMTRALMSGENAAAMQMIEAAATIANANPSKAGEVWRTFNYPRMISGMSRNRGMRADWLATPQEQAQAAQAEARAQAEENRIKALPAEAAQEKARAITAKAQTGGNIGGVLSGTPASGMPEIPGQPPGMPGRPSPFGGPGLPGRPAMGP